jgi:cell shape-determining protein MreC
VFELGARLGVNGFLALLAAVSLSRLAPHLQAQVKQLEVVRQELAQAEAANVRLRSDFDRYFDPAQADRVIQEQTGYRVRSERQVVWTD